MRAIWERRKSVGRWVKTAGRIDAPDTLAALQTESIKTLTKPALPYEYRLVMPSTRRNGVESLRERSWSAENLRQEQP